MTEIMASSHPSWILEVTSFYLAIVIHNVFFFMIRCLFSSRSCCQHTELALYHPYTGASGPARRPRCFSATRRRQRHPDGPAPSRGTHSTTTRRPPKANGRDRNPQNSNGRNNSHITIKIYP